MVIDLSDDDSLPPIDNDAAAVTPVIEPVGQIPTSDPIPTGLLETWTPCPDTARALAAAPKSVARVVAQIFDECEKEFQPDAVRAELPAKRRAVLFEHLAHMTHAARARLIGANVAPLIVADLLDDVITAVSQILVSKRKREDLYRTGKLPELSAQAISAADRLGEALAAAGTPQADAGDRFGEFAVKPRKLLRFLDGKGKVSLEAAFRAVHGARRRMAERSTRKSFLTLVRRTSTILPTKGHKLTINLEGETIELVPTP